MFKSVLVANRGEIACRVFRTARRMGVRTIAVYSEADAKALHVREADEAVLIGPAPARESYLDGAKVLAAAKATGAEAIHPGYGFLSENADFAEAVMAAGLVWIGPPPAAIRAMGLKDAAKSLMIAAGVPVTPGYLGEDQSLERLQTEADAIGYPVLIKAVAGGGGKGMKKVERAEDFAAGLAGAQREGQASFGDPRVLIEKYITRPRHIEVQVFGDSHGSVVHLYERDCSLQRRHQKVIEEAPAPGMDAAARKAITDAAVRAAKAVDYEGAGTIEFIADASDGLKADRIWFMEMNTRLQVEHPVTEAVTGVDLVEWQFRVAAGEPMPLKQDEIELNGWAMEARLYAEDPANGFLPSIGRLEHFHLPDGIRVDTGVEEGGEVSQFYDPMIAKLIVHAETREEAADALAEAAGQVQVWPVKTNAAFVMKCLEHPRFVAGDVDTGFIAAEDADLGAEPLSEMGIEDAANRLRQFASPLSGGRTISPWDHLDGAIGFRANAPDHLTQTVRVDGAPHVAQLLDEDDHPMTRLIGLSATRVVAFENGSAFDVSAFARGGSGAGGPASDGALRAPMPGKIVATPARPGDTITKGQPVVVLEAMKMEHALVAPFDGVVGEIGVAVGDQVAADAILAVVTAA
ncbi:MAG: ATP-grasp domain-containing protein [Alphaproteobacteria bacterium]|nr:ATP-grasp domain-containing protein [Alphaproteobacteria bacterium]MBU4040887.1 ATP-grasp domain-containing protein [Alphaproteobacteria bacterium]